MDLHSLLRAESDRVEWKQSDRDGGEILRAVCAMANDVGASGRVGHLILGVDYRGQVVGLPYAGAEQRDKAQLAVSSRLDSVKLAPHPSYSLVPCEHEGQFVLVVEVHPYPVPPVVRVDGVAWVRPGPLTRRANDADLARLEERQPEARLTFDQRLARGAALDDLDTSRLTEEYGVERDQDETPETFPSFEAWLGLHGLVRRTTEGWLPTNAGLLLHGFSPEVAFPGAFVDLVRYAGDDEDAPLQIRKTIMGPLSQQLDTLWTQIEALNVSVPGRVDGIRESFQPQYPPEALKELARNLVQHRQYDMTHAPARVTWFNDRVEFSNPGGPFGAAGEGVFGEHSDYRNPTLTARLVEQGYVQRLGRGIRRVRRLLEQNGNPALEVETDGFTTVTVRGRSAP